MDEMINEIRQALNARLWTLSLQGSLALIDICGAMSRPSGNGNKQSFEAWYLNNVGATYPELAAFDVWRLRCGLIHQGRLTSSQYEAIMFFIPDGRGNVMKNFQFHQADGGRALSTDLVSFCNDILEAVELWWQTVPYFDPQKTNAELLVRLRPDGMMPYIQGIPMIA